MRFEIESRRRTRARPSRRLHRPIRRARGRAPPRSARPLRKPARKPNPAQFATLLPTRSRPYASSFAAAWTNGLEAWVTIYKRRHMPLTKEEKLEHVQKFGKHETD